MVAGGDEGMIDVSWTISQPSTSSCEGERAPGRRKKTTVNCELEKNHPEGSEPESREHVEVSGDLTGNEI